MSYSHRFGSGLFDLLVLPQASTGFRRTISCRVVVIVALIHRGDLRPLYYAKIHRETTNVRKVQDTATHNMVSQSMVDLESARV